MSIFTHLLYIVIIKVANIFINMYVGLGQAKFLFFIYLFIFNISGSLVLLEMSEGEYACGCEGCLTERGGRLGGGGDISQCVVILLTKSLTKNG